MVADPKPSKRIRMKPDDRRAAILAAAERCFAERGFYATTVQDIASAAGVTAGALYRYFPGKDAIVTAIIAASHDDVLAAYAAMPSDGGFIDGLINLFDDLIDTPPDRQSVAVFSEVVAESFRNAAVREALHASESELDAWITRRIGEEQDRNRLSVDLDPQAVTLVLTALFDGLILRAGVKGAADANAVRAVVTRMIRAIETAQ